MGPSPHLWFFHAKHETLGPEFQVSVGPRPNLWFCACKPAYLGSELLVSLGSSHHLWFLHSKQLLYDQNNKTVWVPDLTCGFVHAKRRT